MGLLMSEHSIEIKQSEDRLQVHNVGSYSFEQTGKSSVADSMGMRQMQARAFAKRAAQYLLIQAPPACGKSRALMFLALDKVINQGLDKVIIAVPQIAIGSSFSDTALSQFGFFADWHIDPKYNLCAPGNEAQKVAKAQEFLEDQNAHYLLCSHATLVYFYEKVRDRSVFNNVLVAVDEFHHVSLGVDNKLGNVIHSLMTTTSAHIIAMTGSYFREILFLSYLMKMRPSLSVSFTLIMSSSMAISILSPWVLIMLSMRAHGLML